MKLLKVSVNIWRFISLFEKIKLKQVRASVVEGQLVFAVKLKGTQANIACGKLHRKNSPVSKDGFSFNEDLDILTFQPKPDSLPIGLGEVHKLFMEVVKS